jgi:hypothetical protein
MLMRAVETLPLYRRIDPGEDMSKNRLTFEACHRLLRDGGAIALFPEGVSHNVSHLLPLKTGAARIALGAVSVHPGENNLPTLRMVPVGIYYTSKTSLRSEALLRFGESFEIQPVILDVHGEPPRDAVLTLTGKIETALRSVTLNVEDDERLSLIRNVGDLVSSIYAGLTFQPALSERFDLLRRFSGLMGVKAGSIPHGPGEVRERVETLRSRLEQIGLEPEMLSVASTPVWNVIRYFFLRVVLLVIAAPIALIGIVLHLSAYLLATAFARSFKKHGIDESYSTVRILAAIILVPLTWLSISAIFFLRYDWRFGLLSLPLSSICGYVAMRAIETLVDLKYWFRAALVLLRQRRHFLELLVERRALQNELDRIEPGAS